MIVIIIVMRSIWQLYDLYTPFLLLVYDMLWLIIASCSIIQPVLYRAMTELSTWKSWCWSSSFFQHPGLGVIPSTWIIIGFMTTPGCGNSGTLAGPSVVLVDFRWSKPKRFADVPGPKRPGALGRPGRPGSVPPTRRSPPEEIWRSYTIHIPFIYQCSLKHAFGEIAWCPPPRDACVYAESDLRWQFHGRICSKNTTRIKT
jgi:hypothetical protein